MSEIFNIANRLTEYSIKLGDIDLVKESILSVEISYENNSPVIFGKIIINDLIDLSNQQVWRDNKIVIYYKDLFDEEFEKTFIIVNIAEKYNETFEKTFIIGLQDEFSYLLENGFISKGFNSNPVTALNEYINDYYNIEIETNFTTDLPNNYNFVVPKNISNLDWFLYEFNKLGFTFYQTKNELCVKSLEDLKPSNLELNDVDKPYLNETSNQLYKNKIIDLNMEFQKRLDILPQTRTKYFDFETKTMLINKDNANIDYALNNDVFNLQEDLGYKDSVQQHKYFSEHTKILKDSFLKQNEVQMIVNGFIKNDLNQVYELNLKGNKSSSESQFSGNKILNGLYISNTITDKIIGDALIQKISLQRTDLNNKD